MVLKWQVVVGGNEAINHSGEQVAGWQTGQSAELSVPTQTLHLPVPSHHAL